MIVRILLVDDDETTREITAFFMKKIFEDCTLEIDEAENGLIACQYLQDGEYDLVLLDLLMPIQDGFQTLTKMRESSKGKNLPIVVVSSMHQEIHVLRALKLGATDFVRKPFSPEELALRIRNHVPKLIECSDPTP